MTKKESGTRQQAITSEKPSSRTNKYARRDAAKHSARLRKVIEKFKESRTNLSREEKAVLVRLLGDERAARAFAIIASDESGTKKLLLGCIEADALRRIFPDFLKSERAMLKKLQRFAKTLDEISAFLDEIAKPSNVLAASVFLDSVTVVKIRSVFRILKDTFEARKNVVAESGPRLGATRKSGPGNKLAAETAAIGWLAAAVKRVGGRPHYAETAEIAEVALSLREVSIDRVREALRTREQRDWRVGFGPLTERKA